ncbi:hypothetical protein pb186bvf_014361 [Paramecium bursaria]
MDLRELIFSSILDPTIYKETQKALQDIDKPEYDQTQLLEFFDTPQALNLEYGEASKSFSERYIELSKHIQDWEPFRKQNMHYISDNGTYYLNWNAFITTIKMLGTQEQYNHFAKQINDYRIIGGYAQTEISHGSNVQGLQLTATLVGDSFILNSPNVGSYKYWPGLLGLKPKHLSMTNILEYKPLQYQQEIQKPTSHWKELMQVMLAPKLGFLRADNGYLGLKNYKIPKFNMLSRYTSIKENGEVVQSSKDAVKFGYGSMLFLRLSLANVFAISAAFGNVVSLSNGDNNTFGIIRSSVISAAIIIANRQVHKLFTLYNQQLEQGDPKVSNTLTEVHILSSQFKSLAGWETVRASRESCLFSTFGTLNASSLITRYADNVPYNTYEGDNNVLLQQAAQYLSKQFAKLSQGKNISGICQFANKYSNKQLPQIKLDNFENLDQLVEVFERLTYEFTKTTLEQFQQSLSDNSINKAWNEIHQTDLIKMATIFGYTNIIRLMFEEVVRLESQMTKESYQFVKRLAQLSAAYLILEYRPLLVAFNIINVSQVFILDEIDKIIGDKHEFLTIFKDSVQNQKQRNFTGINWNNLNLHPKL